MLPSYNRIPIYLIRIYTITILHRCILSRKSPVRNNTQKGIPIVVGSIVNVKMKYANVKHNVMLRIKV